MCELRFFIESRVQGCSVPRAAHSEHAAFPVRFVPFTRMNSRHTVNQLCSCVAAAWAHNNTLLLSSFPHHPCSLLPLGCLVCNALAHCFDKSDALRRVRVVIGTIRSTDSTELSVERYL